MEIVVQYAIEWIYSDTDVVIQITDVQDHTYWCSRFSRSGPILPP